MNAQSCGTTASHPRPRFTRDFIPQWKRTLDPKGVWFSSAGRESRVTSAVHLQPAAPKIAVALTAPRAVKFHGIRAAGRASPRSATRRPPRPCAPAPTSPLSIPAHTQGGEARPKSHTPPDTAHAKSPPQGLVRAKQLGDRITECSGLEGTSVGHLVQPSC